MWDQGREVLNCDLDQVGSVGCKEFGKVFIECVEYLPHHVSRFLEAKISSGEGSAHLE